MKKSPIARNLGLLALTAALAASPAVAEVLVTRRIHVNSFYHEGVQRPERTDITSLWIAPARAACVVGRVRIVIDAGRDLVVLIDARTKTYAQARLSRPVTESMTPDDREAMPGHETTARARKTGETRAILGRTCLGYDLELRSNLDHKAKAWVSAEVPVDLGAYRDLMRKLYAFLGRYDEASAAALLGLSGYVLSQENVADLKGETLRVNRDVIEMSEKPAPAGLFDVPEGYARRPGLTHADVDMTASIVE